MQDWAPQIRPDGIDRRFPFLGLKEPRARTLSPLRWREDAASIRDKGKILVPESAGWLVRWVKWSAMGRRPECWAGNRHTDQEALGRSVLDPVYHANRYNITMSRTYSMHKILYIYIYIYVHVHTVVAIIYAYVPASIYTY